MFAKSKYVVLSALIALLGTSCSFDNEGIDKWGKTKMYSDFLWCDYQPIIMERTIDLEWNEDAKNSPSCVELELTVQDAEGNFTPISCNNVRVYKNDELCPNNCMTVTSDESEVKVGVEFLEAAADESYIFGLRIKNAGDIDFVQEENVHKSKSVIAQKISAEKVTIMNPLALGVLWVVIVLLTILLVWILVVRFVTCPKTPFNKIGITYPNGEDVLVKMHNAHELICTAKQQKCSLLQALFLGKIVYETNEYWASNVTIKQGRTRNDIRISSSVDVVSGDLTRRSTIVVCNENNEKATLEIY